MADNGNLAAALNGGDDEDEALRIAIAMSLGQDPADVARQGRANHDIVDLTQDEEPAETETESPSSQSSALHPGPSASTHSASTAAPAASYSSSSMLGLDRKQMEEERQARLKLKRPAPGPSVEEPKSSRQRLEIGGDLPRALGGTNAVLKPIHHAENTQTSEMSASSAGATRQPFPHGVVKRTWAYQQPRLGDDIKIEEVLQKDSLELAVLSSYQWDDTWLMSKLDLAKTKVVLIAFAANETQKREMSQNAPSCFRFCWPPMQPGMSYMHSKLQLLKYKDYMRIVVPTGNLVPYDWGETGVMENMVFIIDLPRIEDEERIASNKLTAFGEDLFYFLSAQGLDQHMVKSLRKYDFTETSRYGFVHSISGSSKVDDDSWTKTGYCGLGRAVHALGLSSTDPIDLDYVTSSLGSMNTELLRRLYYACQGDSGMKEFKARTAKSRKATPESGSDDSVAIKSHSRVFYPSKHTILNSRGKQDAAGTICFQSKWWAQFPREVLRDCVSTRPGLLMHNKVLYVHQHDTEPSGAPVAFAYVGSANLSESAWGRLVKDRATAAPKMTVRNWECGVIVPVSTTQKSTVDKLEGDGQSRSDRLNMFEGCVPVPMKVPGTPYVGTNKEPWFSQEA